MPRNIKPVSILEHEKKSHRTKAELRVREEAEKAALSGKMMKEFPSVKRDPVAHKEFLRVRELLTLVEKNDSLYEGVINRYCEMVSEISDLKEQRNMNLKAMEKIRNIFDRLDEELDVEESAELLVKISNALAKVQASVNRIDSSLSTKRSMLFAIEKENIFTIASALRTIPKKPEKEEDDLITVLKGG